MKRFLSILFISCSIVLVLGHSIFPHNHLEEKCAKHSLRNLKDLSLFDIFKSALSHDLGANHLEEYIKYNLKEFTPLAAHSDLIMVRPLILSANIYAILKTKYMEAYSILIPQQFSKGKGLRAPPR